jgi:hypothetical protein
LRIVPMRRSATGQIAGFCLTRYTGEPAPFEQMVVVGQFVAKNFAGVEASSDGIDKVQAKAAANELPALLACLDFSHYYRIVTSIISLTGYREDDIL